MPSPMQDINTKLIALEAKIDQLLARPQIPSEVNLEGITSLLGQVLAKVEQIQSAVAPQTPVDLNAQAQQALATLQAIQAQLQAQIQAVPEPLIPEVL